MTDLAPTHHAPLTERILYEVKKVVVGQDPFLERVLVAILAQGGLDIAPYHAWDDKIPAEVKKKVADARAAILDGSLKVPLEMQEPKSD